MGFYEFLREALKRPDYLHPFRFSESDDEPVGFFLPAQLASELFWQPKQEREDVSSPGDVLERRHGYDEEDEAAHSDRLPKFDPRKKYADYPMPPDSCQALPMLLLTNQKMYITFNNQLLGCLLSPQYIREQNFNLVSGET